MARLSNLVIVAGALAVMSQLDSIQSAWHASLLLGAGMGAPLVLRWLWWRVTAAAELTAIAGATVAAPILMATLGDEGARMLAVTALTATTTLVISTIQSRAPSDVQIAFYRRVHPPGLWGPVARAAGEDPREPLRALGRGVASVALGAIAIFSALVAIGSWLVGSPPPGFAPGRAVWIGGLLVVSAGAALTLYRRIGQDDRGRTESRTQPR